MSVIQFPQGGGQPVGGGSHPQGAQPGELPPGCKPPRVAHLPLDRLLERERGRIAGYYDNARYHTVEQKRQAMARAEGLIRAILADMPEGPLPDQLAFFRLIGQHALAHQFYASALRDLGEA